MKIYMFHYVTKNFNYYHFDADDFEKQIIKLKQKYNIIGLKSLSQVLKNNDNKQYIMLTFDDGTKDHYEYVYPILKKHGVIGVFFLSSNIVNKKILDIQKIHRLLSIIGEEKLYEDVNEQLKKRNISINNDSFVNTTFDSYKMRYIKQLLQYILPEKERKDILNFLVNKYSVSKKYEDYYMTYDQIIEMKKNNMEFGLHTENHKRLDIMPFDEQKIEIINNFIKLQKIGILSKPTAISYPFGAYNNDTINILKEKNIKFGFTIDSNLVDNNPLTINRIDCNYLK